MPVAAASGEWGGPPTWQALQLQGAIAPAGVPPLPTVLAFCPGPDGEVRELTQEATEQLKRLTTAEFRMLWRHMCMQAGLLVPAAEALGPGSTQNARLERFLSRIISYISKVLLLSPEPYLRSLNVNLETGRQERPGDDFWASIGAAIKFTPEQLEEVGSLCTVLEQKVAPVLQERSALMQQLSVLMAAVTGHSSRCTTNNAVEAYSAVDDLADRLQRNALKERFAHGDTGAFLCWSVMNPLQLGKSLTACYPYIPDSVAIMQSVSATRRRQPQLAPGCSD
ncbi:hypothetical protein GPECTOR_13g807 [Gonium pectorale]|uniref:Uncharacterized protein n=1 Tax=Gonium pectorale TaxID=33097 RepID=A0A150GPQ8_GONPE|nr:hypothetical protein GPECTOR_13g807 [Gonium pectorale]|eukprot:KXZ51320.1 hypothetical protein GPECTOR_13g807 [Gonium pectorale]